MFWGVRIYWERFRTLCDMVRLFLELVARWGAFSDNGRKMHHNVQQASKNLAHHVAQRANKLPLNSTPKKHNYYST